MENRLDWVNYEPTESEFDAQLFVHAAVWDYAYDHDDIWFPTIIREDYTMEEWDDFLGDEFLNEFKEIAGTDDTEKLYLLFNRACENLDDDEYEDWDTYWNPDEDDEDEDEDEDY